MNSDRLAMFGGAFDPVHQGHVAMLRWALAQRRVTQVVVVPCFQHPWNKLMAAYAHRLQMCEVAAAAFDAARVTVSPLERELGGVSFSARTIRALQARHPEATLALLLGADAAATLETWQEGAWLRAQLPLIVVPRGAASPIPDISSSQIRDRCARGESIADLVPAAVAEYIARHGLYRT